MKQFIGQLVFMLLVVFAVFGPIGNVWVGYAENIITFLIIIMFFVMIGTVYGALNIEEILEKSPPKQLLTPLYVGWTSTYYFIVVISFIMAGWFFAAVIWAVTGLTIAALMKTTNEVYAKNHPDDERAVSSKSTLQEMADED
jgi:uncharacterized protein YacL